MKKTMKPIMDRRDFLRWSGGVCAAAASFPLLPGEFVHADAMAQEGLTGLADDMGGNPAGDEKNKGIGKSKGKDGEIREVGTLDFEAYLPYRGSREESEWLEFQNASNNGDKYPKGFNVKSQGSEGLYSGCTGIGMERWLAVFIAQKGMDPENWPDEFVKRIGELPEGIKFL